MATAIRLTREVRFSVDRDWAGQIDFDRPIHNSWGGWPSAVGLVPYLCLRASVTGSPDPVTGYLCNIKRIDELLRSTAIPLAARKLDQRGWKLSAEQLLQILWPAVAAETPSPATLAELTLLSTPYLRYAIKREQTEMVTLTQQFEFSAAHRLHCPALSDDENRQTFGKCNNPHGHGHNYVVEVSVTRDPEAAGGAPGCVLPLPEFERIVDTHVIEVLDHKHLNEQVPQFAALNPSVENIARVIFDLLKDHVAPATLSNVKVFETPKTWAEYGRAEYGPAE